MVEEFETKFSGIKDNFDTGATRDKSQGKGRYDLITPIGVKRLARVYERGAVNHGDRNWEKGIPLSRCMESAIRHIYQYLEGMRDEDHLGQAAWNLFAAMHVEEMVQRGFLPKELDNLSRFVDEEKKEKDNFKESKV